MLMFTGCNSGNDSVTQEVKSEYSYEDEMVRVYADDVIPAIKLNETEQNTRDASVKVFTPGMGRGSGCYVTYKGTNLVITAAHVINDSKTNWFWVVNNKQKVKAHAAYFNGAEDIALLAVPDAKIADPVPLAVENTYPDIGEEIIYSGWPGHHSLLTIRGEVVGYQKISRGKEKLVVHTYGWPGASGSCFFNAAGAVVGILVALPVERGYVPQLLESMVYATPIKHLDLDKLDKALCTLPKNVRPEMCK